MENIEIDLIVLVWKDQELDYRVSPAAKKTGWTRHSTEIKLLRRAYTVYAL